MSADPQRGVPLRKFASPADEEGEPGIWYREPVALAMEAVVEAAQEFSERPYIVGLHSSKTLTRALDALAEARTRTEET